MLVHTVNPLMLLQCVGSLEALPTDMTRELSHDSLMGSLMSDKVVLLTERVATLLARVQPFARMFTKMQAQTGAISE